MLILGLSGGRHLPQEISRQVSRWQHDAAAVLVEDGRIVAGIEEERLNRIKHTNRAPLYAPRFCLQSFGITGRDLDHVAFYWDDASLDFWARMYFLHNPDQPVQRHTRTALHEFCREHLGITLPSERYHFVRHHVAHAVSAFALSGFERSLVVTLDGQGEQESGLVAIGHAGGLEPLASFSIENSLGYLYQEVINFLGYKIFDEYKVMGLAPYGDPARHRAALRTLYTLLPDGGWHLHRERLIDLYSVITPRRKGAEITQEHKDFAAAVQEMLETIVFHLLTHYRRTTNERNLCLSGGVAHNCTMNGRIIAAGLFDEVFVQPAAHDAGAALGAALQVYLEQHRAASNRPAPIPRLEHLYWGTHIGSDEQIRDTLERWRDFISFERADDICQRAAALMAEGRVIGWAQGRSEFGPRALGNRSIVADPRPAEHKRVINAMVKKREAYRPFAPSVLIEDVDEYFVRPGLADLSHMVVVVDVRPEKRELLGAVTHVDGSARVQTVSRSTNERYWRLIKAFKDLTGVPVVLNTSFNNNVEPIVDSVEDAIVCFLTTKLHYLAVGDWLVRKRNRAPAAYGALAVAIPPHYRPTHTKVLDQDWRPRHVYQLASNCEVNDAIEVSRAVYDLLMRADGRTTVKELCTALDYRRTQVAEVLKELAELWSRRAVTLRPAGQDVRWAIEA
jgi:carbamoyltransferase